MKKIYALHMINLLLITITFEIYAMNRPFKTPMHIIEIPILNHKDNPNEYKESLEDFICDNSSLLNNPEYANNHKNDIRYIRNEERKRKSSSNITFGQNEEGSTEIFSPISTNSSLYDNDNNNKKEFSCHYCHAKCLTKDDLSKHIKTIHKSKIFFCQYCDNMYLSQENLNLHIKTTHKEKIFNCLSCSKVYIRETDLQKHLKESHGITLLLFYNNQTKRYTHERTSSTLAYSPHKHTEELKRKSASDNTFEQNPPTKKQKTISYQAITNVSLNNNYHYYAQNNSLNGDPLNGITNEQINNSANIAIANTINNNQINTSQDNQACQAFSNYNATYPKKTFHCPHCNEKFLSTNELCKHGIRIHPDKMLNCPHCDIQYLFKTQLNNHINYLHSTEKFTCRHNNCGKKHSSKRDLDKHIIEIHANEIFKQRYEH